MVDNHSLKIDAVPVTLRELALTKVRQAIIAGYFKAGDRLGRTPAYRAAWRQPQRGQRSDPLS